MLLRLYRAFLRRRPEPKLDITYNPLAVDEEINCPCHYGASHACGLHPTEVETSETLALLERLDEIGIGRPKKDVLKNDNRWRPL
jgi:hypothetical protein